MEEFIKDVFVVRIKMVDKEMSFRERNRIRLAKKGKIKIKSEVKGEVYESGERSKVLDFFIGFGIFFLASFFSLLGIIVVLVAVFIYYKKWFGDRRFVKYGMFSYFVFWIVILLMFIAFFAYYGRPIL